ncbi:MAG: hypothetical protein M1822_004717 [Bathelium mastoideum]|nr:MAG: hypothetical protein M1822_004717 [Bathelium mastoideum]
MKRTLTPAFSTKSLVEHEPLVQEQVDIFIAKVSKLGGGSLGINMTDWYEMAAFDILGEMAFGESFRSMEDEHPHFWSQLVEKHLFYVTMLDNLRRYPWVKAIGQMLLPWFTVAVRDQHTGYTRAKVEKRLKSKQERADILTNIVAKFKEGEVSKEELTAHSSTLVYVSKFDIHGLEGN